MDKAPLPKKRHQIAWPPPSIDEVSAIDWKQAEAPRRLVPRKLWDCRCTHNYDEEDRAASVGVRTKGVRVIESSIVPFVHGGQLCTQSSLRNSHWSEIRRPCLIDAGSYRGQSLVKTRLVSETVFQAGCGYRIICHMSFWIAHLFCPSWRGS